VQLAIENVTKRYRKGVVALRNFSLELKPGVLGLLGPNGAGKTTLMSILATITSATEGRVLWKGVDIASAPDTLRSVLGYLPQDFGVYPKVTAAEMLDHFARLKGLTDTKTRKATVDALLERVNLARVRDQKLGGFSGGMRQRFGIAQALLGSPKLIIVDEPTAGLDPEERVRFHNLLADIGEDVIVILSTHIVDDVADLCPRFAVISKGRVLLAGEPREAVSRLEGRVWQRAVPRDEVAAMQAQLPVISTRLHAGRTIVRAFSASPPAPGFEPAAPELEDVYFSAVAGHLVPASTVAA